MVVNRDSTPPPVIGKIGPYTVFITPPSTPKPVEQPVFDSPKKAVLPPVQPPPHQFDKSLAVPNDSSVLGFLKNAFTKAQNAHSSLDDHLARWFGLNQSKYQWAMDDYYEGKGLGVFLDEAIPYNPVFNFGSIDMVRCWIEGASFSVFLASIEKGDGKEKEMSSKMQSV